MHLEIVTPAGSKLKEEVDDLTAPGVLGEMDVLPGHIPVLTVLDIGQLTYITQDKTKRTLAVNGGYLEVNGDDLIVITETAEFKEEIDAARAQVAADSARKALESLESGSADFKAKLRSLKRAENRLTVAGE